MLFVKINKNKRHLSMQKMRQNVRYKYKALIGQNTVILMQDCDWSKCIKRFKACDWFKESF